MTEFVRRYSATRPISGTIDWIDEEYGKVERLRLITTSEDLDINVYVDGGDNIGVNTAKMEEYGQINPNNGFWLSRVDSTASPAVYYVQFRPIDLQFEYIDIEFESNVTGDREIKEAEFIYRKLPEEGPEGVRREPLIGNRPGREFDVVSIG